MLKEEKTSDDVGMAQQMRRRRKSYVPRKEDPRGK